MNFSADKILVLALATLLIHIKRSNVLWFQEKVGNGVIMTSKYGLPELPLVIWKKLENLFPLRHQK